MIIIDKNTRAFASSSSVGNIIASSYFQLETTEIVPTIARYSAKIPKFSGVNNLVNIGVAAINMPCDKAVPDIKVITLKRYELLLIFFNSFNDLYVEVFSAKLIYLKNLLLLRESAVRHGEAI